MRMLKAMSRRKSAYEPVFACKSRRFPMQQFRKALAPASAALHFKGPTPTSSSSQLLPVPRPWLCLKASLIWLSYSAPIVNIHFSLNIPHMLIALSSAGLTNHFVIPYRMCCGIMMRCVLERDEVLQLPYCMCSILEDALSHQCL